MVGMVFPMYRVDDNGPSDAEKAEFSFLHRVFQNFVAP
jgi:hypothetical protein